MTRMDLQGRVALVTGASRGIGRCIAEAIADAGGTVAVHYNRRAEDADAVVESLHRRGAEALAIGADMRCAEQVGALVDTCAQRWGGLDILVCNAGIWKGAPVESMREQDWDEMIDINLKGMYLVTRAAIPHLKRSRGAAIVNIASTAGQRGEAGHAHYAASKGGTIAWTKSLAAELAPDAMRVNCVAPGWVHTEMAQAALREAGDSITRNIPLGRAGNPEEIAAVACFLATDLASYITGEIVNVNGGSVLCG